MVNRKHIKVLAPLYLVVFFGSVSITTPIFTYLFLGPESTFSGLGGTTFGRTTWLGITLALFPLGQFVGSPMIGHLSDHYGRRPLLLATLLLTALFMGGVAVGLHLSIPILVGLCLFLGGLCEGNVALAQSCIADAVAEEHRTTTFGWVWACANLGHVVGPIAAGLLASSSVVSWFGPPTPYWTIAALLLIMMFWIFFFFEETSLRDVSRRLRLFHALTNLKEVFLHRRLRSYYLLNLMIYIAMFGYFRAYPMYGQLHYSFSLQELSLLLSWLAIPSMFANLYMVRSLAKRVSLMKLTTGSAILMGLVLPIVLLPQPFVAYFFTLLPPTLFATVCITASSSLISSQCTPTEQGQVLGNNQALLQGASALSAVVTGLLAGVSLWLPFFAYGTLAALTGSLFYWRKRA